MAEYIEREALLKETRSIIEFRKQHYMDTKDYDALENYLSGIPAADVAPVRHGRWEKKAAYHDGIFNTVACSVCKTYQPIGCWDYYDYCPNCGCRMDLEGENT